MCIRKCWSAVITSNTREWYQFLSFEIVVNYKREKEKNLSYYFRPAELQFYTSLASIVVQIPVSILLVDLPTLEHSLSFNLFAAFLLNGVFFHFQSITAYVLMDYISPVTHRYVIIHFIYVISTNIFLVRDFKVQNDIAASLIPRRGPSWYGSPSCYLIIRWRDYQLSALPRSSRECCCTIGRKNTTRWIEQSYDSRRRSIYNKTMFNRQDETCEKRSMCGLSHLLYIGSTNISNFYTQQYFNQWRM